MPVLRDYKSYDEYISFQKKKTTDPSRIKKWLGEEWSPKVQGFTKEFQKLGNILRPEMRILCLGARLGHEVVALKEMGLKDTIGIDIVPFEPHVEEGDVHNLNYPDNSFDLVYTNIIDHSVDPKKMVAEIERVIKVGGFAFMQVQLGIDQDEYTEFRIDNPLHDVVELFDRSYCLHAGVIRPDGSSNFAGMNFEMLFQKNQHLNAVFQKHGTIETVVVPDAYREIWESVNLQIQEEKLTQCGILDPVRRSEILASLMRRAYYLVCLAKEHDSVNIAEVGTAQGWQYYSFCEYASTVGGLVFSCDIRDVRNSQNRLKYEEENSIGHFSLGGATSMAEKASEIDFFYIDGSHDSGAVISDIISLLKCQRKDKKSIWVFDDFDTRFGCFKDIAQICIQSRMFKIMKVGVTASGNPNHQAIVMAHIKTETN